MKPILAPAIILLLANTACATTPIMTGTPPPFPSKRDIMTTDENSKTAEWEARPIHPTFTAEVALRGALQLLRDAHALADITPQKVEEVMGVSGSSPAEGAWGFAERITRDWAGIVSIEHPPYRTKDAAFEINFLPRPDLHHDNEADTAEICTFSFEEIKSELENMGFTGHPKWGYPNQLIGYFMQRAGMYVDISVGRSSSKPPYNNCITTFTIG